MTITIHPKLGWQVLPGVIWIAFVVFRIFAGDWRRLISGDVMINTIFFALLSVAALLSLIRRERVEIYPDQMVWRKTYFGFTRSRSAPLADVLGAEWNEGQQQRDGKAPDYVEFYLPAGTVKACYGFTFDEFDRMREDIRTMYPDLIKRWGRATVRSKDLTLLNLS